MSIEIRDTDDPDAWDALLADAETATGFHLAGALDVLAEASGTTVHRLVGYKGEEPVGLYPVFTRDYGPVTAAFSPPPDLKVPYLGPVVRTKPGTKQRLRERRHVRFVDACEEWLGDEYRPRFVTAVCAPGYADVRPFAWNDYEATPRYTYVVDVDREREDLLASFSRNARRNVRDDHDVDYVIREGGPASIAEILPAVTARHEEQDEPYPIDASFVEALYGALPAGTIRPVVCRVDGRFVGGHVVVEYGDTAIVWLSATDRDAGLPVGDLLVWWYVERALDSAVSRYDFAGANLKRLSQYKAKFDPSLVPYYRVQRGTRGMNVASSLYSRIRQ